MGKAASPLLAAVEVGGTAQISPRQKPVLLVDKAIFSN